MWRASHLDSFTPAAKITISSKRLEIVPNNFPLSVRATLDRSWEHDNLLSKHESWRVGGGFLLIALMG
jgi:hypothetical protein